MAKPYLEGASRSIYCGVPLCCPWSIAFVSWERGGVSVCLSRGVIGALFALCPCSRRFQTRSFWTASVEPANVHPVVFLTPDPSTAVFQVCWGTVTPRSSRRSRLSVYLLFSQLSSTNSPHLCISGPFRGCMKP